MIFSVISSKALPENLRLDAEYFQPKYLEFYGLINNWDNLGDYVQPPINGDDIREYDESGDTFYLRTGEFDFEGLHLDKVVKIHKPQDVKVNIKLRDVLFTRKGNYGKSAVVNNEIANAVISSEIMLLRAKDNRLNPYYLTAFLNTRFGQIQIERNIHGVSNFSITQDDVVNLKIKILPHIVKKVENLLAESDHLKFSISKFYYEAEQELLERIEWQRIATNHQLNYTTTSKDIRTDERLDPEFYQPKFENLQKHLKKIGSVDLGKFCLMPNRGVQPTYEDGEVLVINSKHLGSTEIDIDNAEKTTRLFYDDENNEKARIKNLDVLMYSTGAYVGRTNAYLSEQRAIASNHVTIIRPDTTVCDPVYLALFLNSPAGLMQTDQRASGSAQREIYPQEIVCYQIFIPCNKNGKSDLMWQTKLAEKVISANKAKKGAKQKFEEAKQLMGKEIEQIILA